MCCTCKHNNSKVCPACLKQSYYSGDIHKSKGELIAIFFSGIATLTLFLLYQYMDRGQFFIYEEYVIHSIIAFLVGISISGAYFMLRNTNTMSEISEIPFFGGKLSIIFLVIIVVTGAPALYFLYKLFQFVHHNQAARRVVVR